MKDKCVFICVIKYLEIKRRMSYWVYLDVVLNPIKELQMCFVRLGGCSIEEQKTKQISLDWRPIAN